MTRRLALLVVPAAAAVLAAAAAHAAPYVIVGDTSVAGLRIGRADPADARLRFGAPSASRRAGPYACVASWRRIGLVATFLDLSQGNACRTGVLLRATVTSRGAWRTAVGLRVGDAIVRLKRLIPGRGTAAARPVRPGTGSSPAGRASSGSAAVSGPARSRP